MWRNSYFKWVKVPRLGYRILIGQDVEYLRCIIIEVVVENYYVKFIRDGKFSLSIMAVSKRIEGAILLVV